jgi:hypothetical protein
MRAFFNWATLPQAVVPVWLLPLAVVVDAAVLLAVELPGLRVPGWVPFPRGTPEVAKRAAVIGALGGLLGALALYSTLAGVGMGGVTIPATPVSAGLVALLTGALGGAIGALLAARIVRVVGMAPDELAPLPFSATAQRLVAWGQGAMAHWGAWRR